MEQLRSVSFFHALSTADAQKEETEMKPPLRRLCGIAVHFVGIRPRSGCGHGVLHT